MAELPPIILIRLARLLSHAYSAAGPSCRSVPVAPGGEHQPLSFVPLPFTLSLALGSPLSSAPAGRISLWGRTAAAQDTGVYLPILSFGDQAFNLEKRRLRANRITVFQYLKGGCREDGSSVFTGSRMEEARGSELYWERFHLDKRKKFQLKPGQFLIL